MMQAVVKQGPAPGARTIIPLTPDGLQSLYGDWEVVRRKRDRGAAGFTATKPERQLDTAVNVSE